MNRLGRVVCLCSCLVIPALILSSCGKAKEEASEAIIEGSLSNDKTKVNVDLGKDGEQVNLSATTEEGTVNVSVGPNTQVPKEWPTDVSIYPGTSVSLSNVMADQGNCMIQGTVAAPLAKVKEFYTADLEKQGWKVEQSISQPPAMESIVAGKEARQLTVMLISEGDSTTLSLNVSKKEG